MGLQPVKAWDEAGVEIDAISADGSWAGRNDITANIATDNRASGLVRPGTKMRYLLYAPVQSEGSYLLYSTAATNGISPTYGGQLMQGNNNWKTQIGQVWVQSDAIAPTH